MTYASLKSYTKTLTEMAELAGHGSPLKAAIQAVLECSSDVFERLHPFKIGETATLVRNQDCSSGWYSYRHILVEGSTGTVSDLHFSKGVYWVTWTPFEKSWMDSAGLIVFSTKEKHFVIWAGDLRSNPCDFDI